MENLQRKIRENSNKLCRLFKENKNVQEDIQKVKEEQAELS
jgi:hypothetical protein